MVEVGAAQGNPNFGELCVVSFYNGFKHLPLLIVEKLLLSHTNLTNMQTILGANGTIGKLLAKELTAYTGNIRIVSRNPQKINSNDEIFAADLTNPALVDKAVEGSEVVYLTVGLDYDIKVWREKWPKIMRSVIDACKKHHAKLVFFDNVYMYDRNAVLHMTENSPINPPSEKGKVRREISEMINKEVRGGQLTALIARSADFYGPGFDKSIFHLLIYASIMKGQKSKWMGNPDKKHCFTYTPDAARATALLGNTPDAYNQVWHLPTDIHGLTGREYVSIFAKELKVPNKLMVVPVWMLKIMGWFSPLMRELPEMMYQYDRDYIFDSSKFEGRFGLKPVSYNEGIKHMIAAETKKEAVGKRK